MKKIFLSLFVLIGLGANAQYFQHLYGDYTTYLWSGINTKNLPIPGHLMASGINNVTMANHHPGVLVTYTDDVGNTIFNNVYSMINTGGNLSGGGYETYIFEWDNAPNIGVVGFFGLAGQDAIYYLQLDDLGNVIGVHEYNVPQSYVLNKVSSIAESANGDYLYITGTVASTVTSLENDIFVIKIDITNGNIIWSRLYDFNHADPNGTSVDVPLDIIESPYTPSGVTEIVIVGTCYQTTSPITAIDDEGFFLRINATTGATVAPVVKYNPQTQSKSSERIHSIEVAEATTPLQGYDYTGDGFVLGGFTNENSDGDMWVLKVDPTGTAVFWTYQYDHSNPSSSEICYDVIERQNTLGMYEYYAGGATLANGSGVYNATVMKLDEWGNPYTNGEFTYTALSSSGCLRLDQKNFTASDGLSIYGYAGSTNTHALHIKAYFNGIVDCNESFNDPGKVIGPGISGGTLVNISQSFTKQTIGAFVWQASDINICSHTSIPGGSNARIAPDEPKGEKEGTFSPNPLTQGTSYASLEVEVNTPTAAIVSIYDMLGRTYYTHNFDLTKGKNNLTLNISESNMAAGMYSVRIEGKAVNKTIMLMVK